MQAIAKRNRPVIDLELDIELPARNANAVAAYANAKRVFDGELRGRQPNMPSVAERRQSRGQVKRIELTKAHRQVWMTSATNMRGLRRSPYARKPVSFQTLRRKFGPSAATRLPPKVK